MSTSEIINKIERLPDNFLKSVSDYIDFLLLQAKKDESVANEKKFGSLKGKLWIADDFDAPIDEMKDYM